jgi:Fur family ferric uptake transcriptional regulator
MGAKTRRINPEEVETVRTMIRNAGVRATPARIAAMQELRSASAPLTHAELSDRLVPLGFDKATVFRNLNDLAEIGLVARTELGDHVWRFEAIDPDHPDKSGHPHFVCTSCGTVQCLEPMEFTTVSRRKAASIGRITDILLKGECSDCAED